MSVCLCVWQDVAGPAGQTANDRLFYQISSSLDMFFGVNYKAQEFVEVLPQALAVDFGLVRIIDLTALIRLDEMLKAARGAATTHFENLLS